MARVAPPAIPVPANVFRHFAVITLVVTVLVALFAGGADPAAQAVESAATQDDAEPVDAIQLAADGKNTNGIKVREKTRLSTGWGSDDVSTTITSGYDAAAAGIDEFGATASSAIAQIPGNIASGPPPGVSQEEWERLQSKRKGLGERASQDQIDQMIRQSSLRSGSGGGGD